MVSTRAHLVQFNVKVCVTFAAEFKCFAFSFSGPRDRTANSIVDDRTGVLELTPYLDQELFELYNGHAFNRLSNGCPSRWWSRRA